MDAIVGGRSEFDDVYDVYHNDEFICRMMSDPTELIYKVNSLIKGEYINEN